MAIPLIQVGQRFQCMKIKDVPVELGVPATESEIEAQFKWVLSIDPTLDKERLSKMDLQNAASLQSFMKAHCHISAYAFQVKKCCDNTCYYCSKHQIRLSHEDFKSLHFLPLPLLHPTNKDHYRPFSDVYKQLPSNLNQPSLKVTKEIHNEIDHQRKSLLVAGKVRGVITCGECCKPRCIYAKTRLSEDQQVELQRIRESDIYTCGSSLFLSNDCIVVREGLLCSSVIETQYYSSVLVHFPPICYFCGLVKSAWSTMKRYRN